MSFFDDDEVEEPPRRPTRTQPRRSRPSDGGRPPSGSGQPPRSDHQTIQTRRTVAAVVIVLIIVVLALAIHSCDSSENTSALRDYTNTVAGIIHDSNTTASQLFADLNGSNASCKGGTDGSNLQGCVTTLSQQASTQLKRAQAVSVPNAMQKAQSNFVYAMQLRHDAMTTIAAQIEAAYTPSTATAAVQAITSGVYSLVASDVQYTTYAAKEIAAALHADGIAVGGTTGVVIPSSQVVTNLSWLTPSWVAGKLSAKVPSTKVNTDQPGLHGHSLNSVTVGGTTITAAGQSATVPASPAPSFELNLTNGGQFDEYDVVCKITIAALHITQTSTIPETTPNETTNCTVNLPTAPTAGTYSVVAEVEPVPGEKNTSNNSLSFSVAFTSG